MSLTTALTIVLNTCNPAVLIWGCDRILFYNDAYKALWGDEALPLGQPFQGGGIWGNLSLNLESVFKSGQPLTWNLEQVAHDPEVPKADWQCYSGSCSAIWDEYGQVGGVVVMTCYQPIQQTSTAISIDAPLQRHEEQLQLITDAIPALVAYVDTEHYYRFSNQTYEAWFGQPTRHIVGKHVREVLGEAAYQAVLPYMKRALSGERVRYEGQVPYQDGGTRYIFADYVPHINRQGVVEGYFALVSDISDRKHIEETLRHSEEQAQLALKVGRLGTWHYDPVTQQVNLDTRMCEIWGEASETAILPLEAVLERIHPDDREPVVMALGNALDPQSTGTYDINYRIIWPDGTVHWLSTKGQALFAGEGAERHAVSFSGAAFDITQRKQAEASLRESEERLRLAMQGAQMGTWDVDLLTGRAIWSEQYFAMLGYEPHPCGEASEELWYNRIHPDDRAWVMEEWHRSRQEHRFYCAEYRAMHPDGQVFWLSALGSFTYNAQDEAIRSIGVVFDMTDRKRAEEDLRLSEERLRLAVSAARMAAWTWNATTDQMVRSETACEILGLSPEQLCCRGQDGWALVHPDDRSVHQARVEAAIARRGSYVSEFRMIRPDNGRVIWVEDRGKVSCDPQGKLLSIEGALFDITARKRTEEALRESEQWLQLAQQSAKVGTWEWNLLNDECTWSEGVWNLLGLEPESITPTRDTFIKFIYPEDLEPTLQKVSAVLVQGEDYYDEFRVFHRDGTLRWLASQGRVLRNAEGRAERLIGVNIDITNRKQVEEALRNSAEQLSLALAAAKLGDWSWDAATDMVTFSERAAGIFGIPPGPHMTWAQILQLLHEDDRERAAQQVAQAVTDHSDYDIEYQVIRPDGVTCWVAAKGRATYDNTGQVLGMFGVVQDITHRRQAETEREQLLQREKTAREQAETANRIKDEFLAVLSHELRSPLNPILGWARLLQSGSLSAQKTQHALETIERNAKLQTQLIEDLLDVSRILRGKLVLSQAPVNLGMAVDSALETVRLAAEAKNIQVQWTVLEHHGPEQDLSSVVQLPKFQVLGDAARLQQIIWNLLSNAVKFTSPGGHVHIQLEQRDGYAYIQVSDTGKGIRPEFLPYVFEYFRQEDGTTTRKFGGLGLGLAIVRHLTELHGGRVWAESLGEGKGATFTVRLPLISHTVLGRENRTTGGSPVNLSPLSILVVDDEADIRDIVAFILEQAGADVTVATSALEAIKQLQVRLPDVLVCDIGMPDIDGYMLMRQIRSLKAEQGGKVVAIALTAYASEHDHKQALEAGFQMHIAKPVEPEVLVQAIANLMRL
ncbi:MULTISPECIES: PAS domain-containing protein [unclassified Leptolyngbya]|uniref:hybrid sensor histidine kinase/response regulator n=1 Tax=unclassified Leptolyngbya TaxID=2650499 RepID=UPI00168763E7|nr:MULTISPECIES: PAS domain-containing protein [unclassified Leptolyngbya]MBD1909936.1 PAS domain-containing protein [Leptolyngbya sp. FACHB-8]MBD2154939.1 PAS domain-containing protein [Leptolyngbya sp. FACHB-16]